MKILTLLLLLFPGTSQGAEPAEAVGAYKPAERRAYIEAALNAPALSKPLYKGRLRTIRVVSVETEKGKGLHHAEVILVSYANGKGVRVGVGEMNLRVHYVRFMAGSPQPSAEEREEAEKLISTTPAIVPLMRSGAYVIGGFVTDPPAGARRGRYLEFHVGSRDRRSILREAIVNMGTGAVLIREGK